MATYTVTVSDDVHARILRAFGHVVLGADLTKPAEQVDATQEEVEAAWLTSLKAAVTTFEAQQAIASVHARLKDEVWN